VDGNKGLEMDVETVDDVVRSYDLRAPCSCGGRTLIQVECVEHLAAGFAKTFVALRARQAFNFASFRDFLARFLDKARWTHCGLAEIALRDRWAGGGSDVGIRAGQAAGERGGLRGGFSDVGIRAG
jgi:hypothetical protein